MDSPELNSAAELVAHLRAQGVSDEAVLGAFLDVPRDAFCLAEDVDYAWDDDVLPLTHDATLSQPYVVASMLAALAVRPGDRVLDVGSGSGFTTGLLWAMGATVDALELEPELARRSTETLAALGVEADVRAGDGWAGWPQPQRYDGILVSAAADRVPSALLEQLAEGGRMVLPVGPAGNQVLQVVSSAAGEQPRDLYPVRFVPLRRGRGRPRC